MDRGQILTALGVRGLQERTVSPVEEQVGHPGCVELVPDDLRCALPDKQKVGISLGLTKCEQPVVSKRSRPSGEGTLRRAEGARLQGTAARSKALRLTTDRLQTAHLVAKLRPCARSAVLNRH